MKRMLWFSQLFLMISFEMKFRAKSIGQNQIGRTAITTVHSWLGMFRSWCSAYTVCFGLVPTGMYSEIPLLRPPKIKTFYPLKTLFWNFKLFFSSFSTTSIHLIRDHLWDCPKVVFKTTFGQSQRWSYYRNFTVYKTISYSVKGAYRFCIQWLLFDLYCAGFSLAAFKRMYYNFQVIFSMHTEIVGIEFY